MYNTLEHLDSLIRHISLVRENCIVVGKKLIARGQVDFGRILIARGFEHDVSKFYGIEWECLHAGPDVDKTKLELAVHQHTRTNPHHPEYWGGISSMPPIAICELVCDWAARAQEFGTGLREWIKTTAIQRFNIDVESDEYELIEKYVGLLLEDSFAK